MGAIVSISTKFKDRSKIINAPITQDNIDAGPAMLAAWAAPNSQPEPMIVPTPLSISVDNGILFVRTTSPL
jgi:hypothetical protein